MVRLCVIFCALGVAVEDLNYLLQTKRVKGAADADCYSTGGCKPVISTEETTASTTTTAPTTAPVNVEGVVNTGKFRNCPVPDNAKSCHFWGEPHFTHLFGSKAMNSEHVGGRGGLNGYRKVLEFNEVGPYVLAKQGDVEVQVFFCQGPKGTSSGCGLAIKMGDDVVQFVRDISTQGNAKNRWSNLLNWDGDNDDLVDIYVNGEKRSWTDIGNGATTGNSGADVPALANGEAVGVGHYISQLKPFSKAASESKSPVCVGGVGGDGEKFMLDFSVPTFAKRGRHPILFETSVTVWATNPNNVGICGDPDVGTQADRGKYQVASSNLLFTRIQMRQLCDACGMTMQHDSCGQFVGKFNLKEDFVQKLCETSEYGFEKAKESCEGEGAGADGSVWERVCQVEQCATGGDSLAMIHVEEQIEQHLEKLEKTWESVKVETEEGLLMEESFEKVVTARTAIGRHLLNGWTNPMHPNYVALDIQGDYFFTPFGNQALTVYGFKKGKKTSAGVATPGGVETTDEILKAVVQSGMTYTLTFNVAGHGGKKGTGKGNYVVELDAVNSTGHKFPLADTEGLASKIDMSESGSVIFHSTSSPHIGERLMIRLMQGSSSSYKDTPIFDNVKLVALPTTPTQ